MLGVGKNKDKAEENFVKAIVGEERVKESRGGCSHFGARPALLEKNVHLSSALCSSCFDSTQDASIALSTSRNNARAFENLGKHNSYPPELPLPQDFYSPPIYPFFLPLRSCSPSILSSSGIRRSGQER